MPADIFDERLAKPMLIGAEGEAFDSPDFDFEVKMDGERCLAYLDAGSTLLINRRERDVTAQFPELSSLHEQAAGRCIIDGELIVGAGGKTDFEHIKQRSAVRNPFAVERLSRERPATFVAVDILYAGREQTTARPLTERREVLATTLREGGGLALSRVIAERGVEFFRAVTTRGLEGIIAKRRDSLYRMGKRTKDWIKIKHWLEADFVVCGYVAHANAAVASLVLGQVDASGGLVYKGRVAIGLKRDEFRLVKALPRRKGHPFSAAPPTGAGEAAWVRPELVCRVGFMCWTDGGGLRQPFFKELRREVRPETVVEYVPDALRTKCAF